MVREISLTQGRVALIDDDEPTYVEGFNWTAYQVVSGYWYAAARFKDNGKWRTVYLHRLLMEAQDRTEQVVFRNGDGLDCRRANMFLGNRSDVTAHARRSRHKHPFRGVAHHGSRWQARITVNGRNLYLGTFDTAEEAAQRYDAKARELFGTIARTNDGQE